MVRQFKTKPTGRPPIPASVALDIPDPGATRDTLTEYYRAVAISLASGSIPPSQADALVKAGRAIECAISHREQIELAKRREHAKRADVDEVRALLADAQAVQLEGDRRALLAKQHIQETSIASQRTDADARGGASDSGDAGKALPH